MQNFARKGGKDHNTCEIAVNESTVLKADKKSKM